MAAEQTVWGLHIKNVSGDWPIKKGCIAIGWGELGDVSKIPAPATLSEADHEA